MYFDYLLLNRPIITTTDDIEEWKKMTGFAFDLDAFYEKSTLRTQNMEQFLAALEEISSGEDTKAAGRNEIRALTNIHYDGGAADRTVAFIKEKLGK